MYGKFWEMESLIGRLGLFPLTNASAKIVDASEDRIAIEFYAMIANRVTLNTIGPVVDGFGISLAGAAAIYYRVVGSLAKAEWFGISNVAGPSQFPFIEYFKAK